MAISETAKLIASLELKDLFTKQVDGATKSLGKLDKSLDSTQSRAYKAGSQIGTGIKRGLAIAVAGVGVLASQVALGVASLEKVESVTAQTNAVLKSTKDVSKQTADGIRAMSNEFENLNATMDDTAIQAGANVLLTFTNISQKAFKPALQAALDLSTAMGQDLQSSAVQLGKALNDPVKGLTALQRVGVTFTAEQKAQIKALAGAGDEAAKLATKIDSERQSLALLTAEGKGGSKAADNLRTKIAAQGDAYKTLSKNAKDTSGTYKAQQIILAELQKEFGGSFLAQGNTTAGRIAKVKDAIDDLQRALATALLPALGKIADATSKFLTRPEVIKAVSDLGQQIAGLFSDENLAKGADVLKGFFQTAKDLAPVIEASAKATLTLVEAAVNLFKSLPPGLQDIAVGAFAINKLTGGLVTNVAGGIAGAVKDLVKGTRGASPVNPVFVSDVSKGVGLPGVPTAVGGALPAAAGVAGIGTIVTAAAPFMLALIPSILIALDPNRKVGDQPLVTHGQMSAKGGGAGSGSPKGTKSDPLVTTLLDRGGREAGFTELAGKIQDDRRSLGQLLKANAVLLHDDLTRLVKSTKPEDIRAAVKTLVEKLVTRSEGGAAITANAIKDLRNKLLHTSDPETRKILKDAIAKVETKLPGRQYADRELKKADQIFKSSEGQTKKISDLKAIEAAFTKNGFPHAAGVIQQKIDALKHTTSMTTQAIKDKDLSVKVTVPVTNKVVVNSRTVFAQQQIFGRVFGGQQTLKNPGGGIGF